MEEYYKFDGFEMNDRDKSDPRSASVLDLVGKIREVVNGGDYTQEVVINALSNMFAVVAMEAVVKGRLNMDNFIDSFFQQITLATVQAMRMKYRKDVDSAIDHLKKSANLK